MDTVPARRHYWTGARVVRAVLIMQIAKIYHVSHGRTFPLTLTDKGPFRFEITELEPEALANLNPAEAGFQIFLIQAEEGRVHSLLEELRNHRRLDDYPKILILPESEYRARYAEATLAARTLALDDSIRPEHLMTVLSLVLQQEYYRQTVYKLSRDSRQRSQLFETLMELARRELKSAREESAAFRSLVEYDASQKRFEDDLLLALENANVLRDSELLTMKRQLEATDRLSEYRERELHDARATISAAEAALDMSRRESLEREKIIGAMDRLRSFTDREMIELFNENQDLRARLGLPPRAP